MDLNPWLLSSQLKPRKEIAQDMRQMQVCFVVVGAFGVSFQHLLDFASSLWRRSLLFPCFGPGSSFFLAVQTFLCRAALNGVRAALESSVTCVPRPADVPLVQSV